MAETDKLEHLIEAANRGEPVARMSASTSQRLAVALATGQLQALEPPYRTPTLAWDRLSAKQRDIVARHNPYFADDDFAYRPVLYR